MFQIVTVFQISLLLSCSLVSSAYPACDGGSADAALESLIDDHVDRLMELRLPSWGWVNTPGAVLGIQLSKMQSLFGLDRTLETMAQEMKDELDSTNLGKIAHYAMATKASCQNPRNFSGVDIIDRIWKRMRFQFRYEKMSQRIPHDRWYRYGLAVQALCVCGEELTRYHIVRMARGQNDDGSWGDTHSVDDTNQVLLAIRCIQTQKTVVNRPYIRRLLRNSTIKAISFLESSVNADGDDVWIGNKYSTPGALLALQDISDFAECNMAAGSMSNGLAPDERIGAISQRLPAMRGRSVLTLKDPEWTCVTPDPIPDGYVPNYDPEPSLECDDLLPGAIPPPGVTWIDVRLSVQKTLGANINDSFDLTLLVENVNEGNTLLQAMAQARCLGQFQFETVITSFGPSVRSVDGLQADTMNRQYWSLVDAGTEKSLPLGAGRYQPSDEQHILFKLSTW
ncbi:unnamed protein product [Clavelina lepadiformis]|uniref:DUF4430 domain-containing protein n=1 Tax=Clavelina lepadiformis TaxID=159417 RepID=A0ABP0FMN7_CLALP